MDKFVQIIIVIFISLLLWNDIRYETPRVNQLTIISGELLSFHHSNKSYHLGVKPTLLKIEVEKGMIKEVISYDRSLSKKLETTQFIEAGIFKVDGANEVWTLSQNDISLMTYQEAKDKKWSIVKPHFYLILTLANFAILAIMLGLTRWKTGAKDRWESSFAWDDD